MLFQLKKLPEIINLTCFLKSFWILYIDQIIVYNAFYSKLTFYIIKDRCQMHALKVFPSPMWLLQHKLSSPHYRYIRKMRRGDRLPLTQCNVFDTSHWLIITSYLILIISHGEIKRKMSKLLIMIIFRKKHWFSLYIFQNDIIDPVRTALEYYTDMQRALEEEKKKKEAEVSKNGITKSNSQNKVPV